VAILVDYRCRTCGGRAEFRVGSPPPGTRTCPACGADAVRAWGPVSALTKRAPSSDRPPTAPHRAESAPPLCVANPDVPGLCHMSRAAGRAWVARARGDNRALERELEHQETAAATSPPKRADVLAHSHSHSHGESDAVHPA
jgi:hypothetical protein